MGIALATGDAAGRRRGRWAAGSTLLAQRRGLARWRPATGEWDEWTPADGLAGLPVLQLLAEDGVVRGVCGPTDVIRALATSDARARAVT